MKRALTFSITLALLIGAAFAAQAQTGDLDAAFAYLKTYAFGQSRAPLSAINDAVQASYGDAAKRADLEQRLAAAITSGASDDSIRFICRELAEIGGEVSVPALVSLLGHETHAEAALDALERNPSEAAGRALRDTLNTPSTRLKIGVINALGARKDADAVPILATLAADPHFSAAAFLALGRIGGDEAAALIVEAVKQGPTELRPGAVDGYLELASGLLRAGNADAAIAVYTFLSDPVEAPHVRAAALAGLVKAQPDAAGDLLLQAFSSGDEVVEAAAAGLIRDLPEDADLAPYAQKLATINEQGKLLLLPALAARRAEIPTAIFSVLLQGGDAVQLAAIQAMPACADEGSVPLLVALAAEKKGDVKRAARECLTTLPGKKVNSALLDLARGADAGKAAEAVRSLGERGATDAADAVMRLARRSADPVCTEAWRALKNMASGNNTAELAGMLAVLKEENARSNAERAVAAAAARIAEPEKRAADVLALLDKEQNEAARVSLLRVLGQIATPEALAALRASLENENETLRAVVIEAFSAWPDSGPAADLLAVASSPKNDAEHAKAFEGYIRLLRASKDQPDDARVESLKAVAALARDDAEKKKVLAALGDLPTAASFTLIDAYTQEPGLAAEAALAAFSVAKNIWGAYPALVKPRLDALAASADENLRNQASALLGFMGNAADYITAWQVSGPHVVPGKTAGMFFDETNLPDDGAAGWSVFPMGLNTDAPFVADLGRALGGNECVAFLRTFLRASAAGAATLELGTNDGVKVWLNGALIHAKNVGRGLTPNEDKVEIQLSDGWNTLVMAVFQMGGDWSACARVRAQDGSPLTGLQTAVKPE